MKLYSKEKEPEVKISTEEHVVYSNQSKDIDKDIVTLESHIKAYNSLVTVETTIASENYSFVDKNNYVLYNEYINSITSNLGIKSIPIVTQEALGTLSGVALNHHIALEGFIGDMWKKIKEIFSKIYNSIKEFFKKYFTRLGRVKNKLKNLSEVLIDTDKNLSKSYLENVPGGLASKYPVNGNVDSSMVMEVLSNTKVLIESMNDINKKASDFISKDVLDKNFIANINRLKQDIEATNGQIDSNNKDKKEGTVFKEAKFGEEGKHNKDIDNTNSSLAADARDKSAQADKAKDTVNNITSKEINLDSEDVKAEEARKEFADFIKTLVSTMDKVKGKNLIKGKNIKSVSGSAEEGLKIETEDITDTPTSINLESKGELLKMVKESIDVISKAEKLSEEYGKVNDIVMKKLNDVDKLISDLDKTDDAKLGKYKKLLNNKVKVRLNLVKTFFNNYNKVCKNILEMALDTGDGIVEYTVLSLKYFGNSEE